MFKMLEECQFEKLFRRNMLSTLYFSWLIFCFRNRPAYSVAACVYYCVKFQSFVRNLPFAGASKTAVNNPFHNILLILDWHRALGIQDNFRISWTLVPLTTKFLRAIFIDVRNFCWRFWKQKALKSQPFALQLAQWFLSSDEINFHGCMLV